MDVTLFGVIKNEEEGLTEQSKKRRLLQAVGPRNKDLAATTELGSGSGCGKRV